MSAQSFSVAVAADHPAFAGHFPGHPVLPGVVLLAEVIAGAERLLKVPMNRILIRSAKFHAAVAPGSTLLVEIVRGTSIGFTVSCEGTRVASGTLTVGDST